MGLQWVADVFQEAPDLVEVVPRVLVLAGAVSPNVPLEVRVYGGWTSGTPTRVVIQTDSFT